MSKVSNRQPILKPQDLFVLLALLAHDQGSLPGSSGASYAALADQTGLAISAVHASLKRAVAARLLVFQERRPVLLKTQVREFLLHGAKYAYAPGWSSLTRGVPTGYAAAPLNTLIAPSSDPPPVWPHAKGSVRGIGLAPLYPSVPEAALRDERLYALLALFDAVRAGQAREREAAVRLLDAYFTSATA